MKKFFSFLLTAIMVIAMSMPAFAAGEFSITVKNNSDSVSMEGNTYSAYKLFDVTYNEDLTAYSYTIADEFTGFAYTTEEGKEVTGDELVAHLGTLTDKSEALNDFSKAVNKYITSNDITAAGSKTAGVGDTEVTIVLDDAGYYVVAGTATNESGQTVTALCALTTTNPTADVKLKADAPTMDKEIVTENGAADANNAAIGDKVEYKLTSKVPDMAGYNKYFYVLNDTLSEGLTFNDDVRITIDGNALAENAYFVTMDTDANTVEIVLRDFIQYAGQAGKELVITYSATINEKAAIGNTGNTNTVELTYSNNPNFDYQGSGDPSDPEDPGNDKPGEDEPTGETPESTVITYVTAIQLTKVDAKGNTLTGAEFSIEGTKLNKVIVTGQVFVESEDGTWYKLKNKTYTDVAPTSETEDKYEDTNTKYEKKTEQTVEVTEETVSANAFVDESGVLKFTGLAEGEYIITEIVAPDGFNILKAPIKVTITCTEPADVADVNAAAEWKFTIDWNDGNGPGEAQTAATGIIELDVENLTGAELPETGGIGTTIFTVAGIILMLGAVVLLVTKRKMSAKEL